MSDVQGCLKQRKLVQACHSNVGRVSIRRLPWGWRVETRPTWIENFQRATHD